MKINYGIHLGTTSASIARMKNGVPAIVKSDVQKDSIPLCIYVNKKGNILVGNSAYNAYRQEISRNQSGFGDSNYNSFIEFTRTLGTDKTYYSSNANQSFSSTELVAEVLKTLKSFVKDESVNSIVITVPAAFLNNQKEATREAAKLAGFDHIELLQEPVAVAMAYGIESDKKDGFWLVFDFGGGTFDTALLKVEDGIMQVIDSEGDNYLGGQNLDFAIVDEIIIPYIKENFRIDSILADDNKKQILRNAMKFFAEEIKVKLSFNDTYNLLVNEGDCGEDDDGEEFELDITVTQEDITRALAPVFQKAIDISNNLLERNNLKGSNLNALCLVGGDTYSPVLRKMLNKQICKPNTSFNSKNAIVLGAALYASTIDVPDEVRKQTRDTTKIQLDIGYECSTVETEEWISIKILADKTEGEIPKKVFAEITRGDRSWSSEKTEIDYAGEVVEVQLLEKKANAFDIVLYDDKGNVLECEPNSFSIKQGSKIGSATLPYNIGTEVKQKTTGKIVFSTIKGLEKNQSLPAIGTFNGVKTKKPIRPGMESDFIIISIYEGDYGSEGTRTIHNHLVSTIKIDGSMLPALLPQNSDVDLIVKVDKSERITVTAFFPYLDYSTVIEIESIRTSVETSFLENEIRKAKGSIFELKNDWNHNSKLIDFDKEIEQIEIQFERNKNDINVKEKALTDLRKLLRQIDEYFSTKEWLKLEEEIKEEFYRLEKVNKELGNDQTTQVVYQFRNEVEEVIKTKDEKLGKDLYDRIYSFFIEINKTIDFDTVEDLLYELTADEKLVSSEFKNYLEQLSDIKENKSINTLNDIYKKLKEYE